MTFKDLLDELLETYEKKNADYGDSFKKTHLEFGEIAGLTRISDKVNRLVSLSKKTDSGAYFESKRDTYMDLANYCLMQVLVMEGTKEEYEETVDRYEESLCRAVLNEEMKLEESIRKLGNAFNADDYMQNKGPWKSKDMLLSSNSEASDETIE
nr:MAG TPA: Nucleotide modification associated domain 1 [Caudoviricetes sp.]DAP24867.1 MAG TPA: Nucleotide modification associated domain 1 [Bacteriophage sp.]